LNKGWKIVVFLIAIVLLHSTAFGEVVGISVHSKIPSISSEQLGSCICDSMKGIKGYYIKNLRDLGSSSTLNGAKIGKNQRLDSLYHLTVEKISGKTALKVLQYTVGLGKVTNVTVSNLGEYRRPCDLAVVKTLDLLGKEPTFLDRAKPHFEKGRLFASAHRWDQAIEAYTKAAHILPNSGAIFRDMALFLERSGDEGWAIAWYQSALKADALEVPSFLGIARVENGRGNIQAALAVLEKAIEHPPVPPVVFYQLGKQYILLKMNQVFVLQHYNFQL